MRRNPYYHLEYIAELPYLLAFGQANADFKHDVRLNETSVFLWENLENVSSTQELINLCAEHFRCPTEQYDILEATTTSFVKSLQQMDILLPEESTANSIPLYKSLEIAGLFCRLYGPAEAFAGELLSFETSVEFPDDAPIQDIRIQAAPPSHTENGTLLLRTGELLVIEGLDKYILFFPTSKYISEIHVSRSGRNVTIFCAPLFTEEAATEISYAIRISFLYFAQLHGMLAIHSASILYRDKVWLFSAPSGTGKSTHAGLWNDIIGTPIINGDLNLVALRQDTPVVYGIPWCGTSGIYDTRTHPLGGIILLNQGTKNRVGFPFKERRQLLVLHRSVSPSWASSMQKKNLDIIREISDHILICHLFCTKTEEAVTCIKEEIDAFLDRN
ncbi:MAG: PqqD family protein [Lachnospiraceae bacterium]|nr:PqqD family protein [Lachnospiraceae bacterium]